MKNNDVNRVIALSYITPLITLILAVFFLNESVTFKSGFGAILIVLGSYLISTSV